MKRMKLLIACLMMGMIFGCTSQKQPSSTTSQTSQVEETPKVEESAFESCCATDYLFHAGDADFKGEQYQKDGKYLVRIIMSKDGTDTIIADECSSSFVTDGKTLYYSAEGAETENDMTINTLYEMDLETKKQRTLTSGTNYVPVQRYGDYLYFGMDEYADGIDLQVMNLNTLETKKITDGIAYDIDMQDGKVLASTNAGDVDNYPIYIFNMDGEGLQEVAQGTHGQLSGGYVYYVQTSDFGAQYRVMRCDYFGQNDESMTEWSTEYPTEYLEKLK